MRHRYDNRTETPTRNGDGLRFVKPSTIATLAPGRVA
jgi:hypothetical protein